MNSLWKSTCLQFICGGMVLTAVCSFSGESSAAPSANVTAKANVSSTITTVPDDTQSVGGTLVRLPKSEPEESVFILDASGDVFDDSTQSGSDGSKLVGAGVGMVVIESDVGVDFDVKIVGPVVSVILENQNRTGTDVDGSLEDIVQYSTGAGQVVHHTGGVATDLSIGGKLTVGKNAQGGDILESTISVQLEYL